MYTHASWEVLVFIAVQLRGRDSYRTGYHLHMFSHCTSLPLKHSLRTCQLLPFPFPSLVYTTAEVVVPPLSVSHNRLSLVCQTESKYLLNSQTMQQDDLPLRREDLQTLMPPYMESWWFLGELAIHMYVMCVPINLQLHILIMCRQIMQLVLIAWYVNYQCFIITTLLNHTGQWPMVNFTLLAEDSCICNQGEGTGVMHALEKAWRYTIILYVHNITKHLKCMTLHLILSLHKLQNQWLSPLPGSLTQNEAFICVQETTKGHRSIPYHQRPKSKPHTLERTRVYCMLQSLQNSPTI